MNFRTPFLLKPLMSGSLRPNYAARSTARESVAPEATLSRRDLRRIVAEMID